MSLRHQSRSHGKVARFHDPLVSLWKSICSLQNVSHGHAGGLTAGEVARISSLLVPGSTKGTEMGQPHAQGMGNGSQWSPGFPWNGTCLDQFWIVIESWNRLGWKGPLRVIWPNPLQPT